MRKLKTRVAYGKHSNGNLYNLGDTIEEALKANMTYQEYEKKLVELNPHLEITFKVEEK